MSPGFHIQDLAYTFGSDVQPAGIPKAQDHLQRAIASFVMTGVPLRESGEAFPVFGDDFTTVNITSAGTATPVPSKANATRCDWWASVS